MRSVFLLSPNELFKAFLPLVFLCCSMVAGAIVNATNREPYLPKHYQISSSINITGKGKLNHCFPYAQELQRQLYFEAGLLSSMIFFNWTDDKGEVGTHVVVHYWDRHGNQWLADNQTPQPISVYGDRTGDLIQQMYPKLNVELVPTLVNSL